MGRAGPPERPNSTNSVRLGARVALSIFLASVLRTLASLGRRAAKITLWLALWTVGASAQLYRIGRRADAIAALETYSWTPAWDYPDTPASR